jgi:hypothetical protein
MRPDSKLADSTVFGNANQRPFLADCGYMGWGEGALAKGSKPGQSPDSAAEPVVSVAPMEH